ncbi:hypothetical protein [Erythrobacter crassostreae]|uniref:Uncharacterized protein n=1 Tax=Erythrobacter crassostreae TaxID=2828328 RepID=A0A9X1JKF0_9SPHN|nr:hypothetical protein [Erythrobacter crassostrea]MBV7258896.1 hypothetical protein [Erythrobacter crassostrea]
MTLAILSGLLSSCVDGRTEIAPDVNVVELSGSNDAVVDGVGDFLVYPNVVEYEVVDHWLVGKREQANDNSDGSEPFTSGLGYFKLNLSDGSLTQGLSIEECEADPVCAEML